MLLLNLVRALIYSAALAAIMWLFIMVTPLWIFWLTTAFTMFTAMTLGDVAEASLIRVFNPDEDNQTS